MLKHPLPCLMHSFQCWDEKYRSNLVRPETVVNKYLDQEWLPFYKHPHFRNIHAGILRFLHQLPKRLLMYLATILLIPILSELEFGIKNRSFPSFRQAAVENIWARFYGGIHFHNSCIISNQYGKKVGDLVNTRIKMKK